MNEFHEKTDDTVGYGNPPAQSRFKKGQSGNPKGRPRKTAKESERPRFRDGYLGDVFEQEAFRTLQLNENGKPVKMSAMQAIIRSLLVEGVKGNRLAKKAALEMLRREEQEAVNRSIDSYNYLARKKAEGEAKIAQCKKQGVSPPRLFPHPDDILLDQAKLEAHVLGPWSEDQAIPFDRTAVIRDWLQACSVLEEKYGEVKTIEHEGVSASARGVLAMMIENSLPPSLQRSKSATLTFMMDLHGLTKRQLEKRIQALKTQMMNMPASIKERLASRTRTAVFLEIFAEQLGKEVADLLKKRA